MAVLFKETERMLEDANRIMNLSFQVLEKQRIPAPATTEGKEGK